MAAIYVAAIAFRVAHSAKFVVLTFVNSLYHKELQFLSDKFRNNCDMKFSVADFILSVAAFAFRVAHSVKFVVLAFCKSLRHKELRIQATNFVFKATSTLFSKLSQTLQ
jgi:hypothetical protein